jgi:type IV pilus assembly protein PilV
MTLILSTSMARARGFTLVEALVALVVLSIGLLGIASMQLSSLRWNHGASMRSQATLLAYDIVDRMRANQIAANAGEYDMALGTTPTGATVARSDLIRWKEGLVRTLPDGDGSVTRQLVGTTMTYVITVQWNDSRGERQTDPNVDAAAATVSFTLRTQI